MSRAFRCAYRARRAALGILSAAVFTFALAATPEALAESAEGERLTIETALARAASHAPALRQAESNLERAEIALAQAHVNLNSRWSVSGLAAKPLTGPNQFETSLQGRGTAPADVTWELLARPERAGFTGSGVTNSALLSLSANRALWPPPATSAEAQTRSERALALDLARRHVVDARRDAAMLSYEAFHRLQIADARLGLAAEALATAEETHRRAVARRDAGSGSLTEVLEAEIAVNRARESLLAAQGNRTTAERQLAQITGLQGQALHVTPLAAGDAVRMPKLLAPDVLAPADLEESVDRAVAWSRTLQSRTNELELAERAHQALVQAGSLSASMSAETRWQEPDGVSWRVSVNATYALGDGGARALSLQSAEIRLREAEEALRTQRYDLTTDVQRMWSQLESRRLGAQSAAMTVRLRTLERDVAEEQVARGLVTPDTLAARERALRAAQIDLNEALIELHLAELRIAVVTGLELELHKEDVR